MASFKTSLGGQPLRGAPWLPCTLRPQPLLFPLEVPRRRSALHILFRVVISVLQARESEPEIPHSGRCGCQPVISFLIYCVSSFDNPFHM